MLKACCISIDSRPDHVHVPAAKGDARVPVGLCIAQLHRLRHSGGDVLVSSVHVW